MDGFNIGRKFPVHFFKERESDCKSRRIEQGADNLFAERHCPCEISWKNTIWNTNIQYKNEWCTLQNQFFLKDTVEILSSPPSILLLMYCKLSITKLHGILMVIEWCKNSIWETKVKQHWNLKNGTRRQPSVSF